MGATQSRHLRLTLATVAHLLLALAISHIDAKGEQRLVEIIDEGSFSAIARLLEGNGVSISAWSPGAHRSGRRTPRDTDRSARPGAVRYRGHSDL
jgi:aryl-alcohol dehydrogenase-like predicted oxidoreductase